MAITLNDLTVSYQRHPAIHHINGEFKAGSLTAITGPNGAGKSTLLKTLAGILKPESGNIKMPGISRKDIAYLPQAAEIERDFPLTATQLVATGFWNHINGMGQINNNHLEKVSAALNTVGLAGFENRNISSLSSGQFQRALFARLIIQDAKLLLLDEPFSAIDADTTNQLLQIISGWHAEKRIVICVLHDFNQIRAYFPECLLLARKCIGWGNSQVTLDPSKINDSRFFHEAWNENAEICQK